MTGARQNILLFPKRDTVQRDQMLVSIVEEHDGALRRFLRMRQLKSPLQEDVLQEVYLKLSKIEDLPERLSKSPDTLRSYLFVIASNVIRDWIRRDSAREVKNHRAYDENTGPNDGINPETALAHQQNIQLIQGVLKRQKPAHRKAFTLSRFENKSYREIADELSVSVSTVEKYIIRVLGALRQELKA